MKKLLYSGLLILALGSAEVQALSIAECTRMAGYGCLAASGCLAVSFPVMRKIQTAKNHTDHKRGPEVLLTPKEKHLCVRLACGGAILWILSHANKEDVAKSLAKSAGSAAGSAIAKGLMSGLLG